MEKKETFVALALSGKFNIRDLCQQYGISRKTAHKYLKRYRAEGKLGLQERSLMWYRLLGQVGVKFVYEGGVGALPLSENGNKARRRKEAIAN